MYQPNMKKRVGITVVGRDREGIVAVFTKFVFSKNGNIENMSQNVIKGLFGMHIEASFAEINFDKFDDDIQRLAAREEMDVSTRHETSVQKNIAIFVTKEPRCLNTLLDNAEQLKGRIAVIVGTEDTLRHIAEEYEIPFVLVEDKNQQRAEDKLLDTCNRYDIDLIVLARYMRILTPNFVWRYPNRVINIHPSLLPAFPGALAYEQAYERGTKIVGVTSHYVTESLDQGPIILQDSFKVDPDDSLEKIKTKGQRLEAKTLFKAVMLHLENKLDVRWRKVHTK